MQSSGRAGVGHVFCCAVLALVASACSPTQESRAEADSQPVSAPPTSEPKLAAPGMAQPGPSDIVGKFAGRNVTLAELDARAMSESLREYQALYDVRRRVLDQMVDDALLAQAAAERGLSVDALIAEEVTPNVEEVTQAEVSVFFAEQGLAQRGESLEALGPRIAEFLKAEREADARRKFLDELREDVDVQVLLNVPRVEVAVADGERVRGPSDAPITIVEYADFQCGYCARVVPTLTKIFEEYPDSVRLVYRDYPLNSSTKVIAEAGLCAHAQGKFWEFHDRAFADPRALQKDNLPKIAADLSMDEKAFSACLDAREHEDAVDASRDGASKLGVSGTPAFFINGRFINGAQPFEEFKSVIEDELAQAAN